MSEYNEYTDKTIEQIKERTESEAYELFEEINYYIDVISTITVRDEYINQMEYIGRLHEATEKLQETVSNGNVRIKSTIAEYERFRKAQKEAEEKRDELTDKYYYDDFESTAATICNLYQDDVMFQTTETYVDELAIELMEMKNKLENGEGNQRHIIINLGSISLRVRGVYTPVKGSYIYVSRLKSGMNNNREYEFRI